MGHSHCSVQISHLCLLLNGHVGIPFMIFCSGQGRKTLKDMCGVALSGSLRSFSVTPDFVYCINTLLSAKSVGLRSYHETRLCHTWTWFWY